MLRTVVGRLRNTGRIGLLPAAFNPPTTAHVALGESAQRSFALDQIVLVLPAALPHKRIARPGTDERLRWLSTLAESRPGWAAASCPTGLVIDIVTAFRDALGRGCELFVIAGRDAAERWVEWDYGDGAPFREQLQNFRLLVAFRRGAFRVADEHAGRDPDFSGERRVRIGVVQPRAGRDPGRRPVVGDGAVRNPGRGRRRLPGGSALTMAVVRYEPGVGGAIFRRRGLLADLERTLRQLQEEYARDAERVRQFERRYRPAVGARYEELERLRERINRGWEALGDAREQSDAQGPGVDEEDTTDEIPSGAARQRSQALVPCARPEDPSRSGRRRTGQASAP